MGPDLKLATRVKDEENTAPTPGKNLRVGTSGWSYEDWAGPFYPKTIPQELYLTFYAQVFNTCEIDSSFYHIPAEASVQKWAREAPADFTFAAKIPKAITHDAMLDPALIEVPLRGFLHNMRPLEEAGKMDAYLLQLPPKFSKAAHWANLESFLKGWDPARKLAVEFRHLSWLLPDEVVTTINDQAALPPSKLRVEWRPVIQQNPHKPGGIPIANLLLDPAVHEWQDLTKIVAGDTARETFELLRDHQAIYTTVIEPLLPPVIQVTDPRAVYIRFHGFGQNIWFNYDFQPPEVQDWANKVTATLSQTKQVNTYWNNHFSGYAVKNALELLKYMNLAPKTAPQDVDLFRIKQSKGYIPKGQRSMDRFLKK